MKASWKNLHKFTCIFITMLFALSLMLTTIFFISSSDVLAMSPHYNLAYRPGGSTNDRTPELYVNGEFNEAVLDELKLILFGDTPKDQYAQYVRDNGQVEYGRTGSYVVKTPTINANVFAKTQQERHKDYGMIIRLGGIDWMVVSMTLANEENNGDKKDDIILTLYQAEPFIDYELGEYTKPTVFYDTSTLDLNDSVSENNHGTKGESMYSNSRLRKNITEDWTEYALFQSGDFAEKYLVQPQYITYQGTQTQRGRTNPLGYRAYDTDKGFPSDGLGAHMVNEAYNAFSDGWYDLSKFEWSYQFDGYIDNAFTFPENVVYPGASAPRYDAWKYDYIWTPSSTEVGFNTIENDPGSSYLLNDSIWQLTDTQRKVGGPSWTRSGNYRFHGMGRFLYTNASSGEASVAMSKTTDAADVYARPAIHFNLSAAHTPPKATDPTDVETSYNGENQTFDEIIKVAAPAWYDVEKYVTKGYLAVEQLQTGKDVGEYWVKVSITEAWNDAVRAELKNEGLTDEQIKKLLPVFSGSPGTGPGEAPPGMEETATTRYFKIIITPKVLSVTGPTYDATNGVVNVSFADTSEIYDGDTAPTLGLHYTGDYSYNEINVMPWKKGNYKATAILLNADNTEYSGNYTIGEHSCDFSVAASKIDELKAQSEPKEYTGSAVDFAVTGYDKAKYDEQVTLTLSNGLALVESDGGWVLRATNAGTYTIKASLKDKTNFTWSDGSITDKSCSVQITKKQISVLQLNGAPQEYTGSAIDFGIQGYTADGYSVVDFTHEGLTLAGNDTDGWVLQATNAGTYTITASLTDKANFTWSDGSITDKIYSVQITKKQISVLQLSGTPQEYTGSAIDFGIQGYTSDGYSVVDFTHEGLTLAGNDTDGWVLRAKNAGRYTITAHLNDTANYAWSGGSVADQTYNVEITKKKISVNLGTTPSLGGGLSFAKGTQVTASASSTGVIGEDDVTFTLSCGTLSGVGSLDLSSLDIGKYTLSVTLSGTDSANYQLTGASNWAVDVTPEAISLDSVTWRYSQGGEALVLPSDGVPYNGSAYTFTIATDNLAAAGVDIGNIKYSGNVQTLAGTHNVSVTLTAESGYAFYDSGVQSDTKTFTLQAIIKKAEIDFSKVTWSADKLEYNAKSQSVTITAGLPAFLTANYKNNSRMEIGEQTAEVSSLTITNQSEARNWNVPSDLSAYTTLKHKFEIVKKRIVVGWSTQQQGSGDKIVFVPVLGGNTLDAVEYSFWNGDKTQQMTMDEIFAEISLTEVKYYYVKATLKESGGSFNASNSVLVENDVEVPESWHDFQTGDNKTPVYVVLENNVVTYNGSAQPAIVKVDGGGLTTDDIVITYTYKNGAAVSGMPINAGEYTVTIDLKLSTPDDVVLSGQRVFDYTIEKAAFDMSAVRWTDESGAEFVDLATFEWAPSVTKTLKLSGVDSKLSVNYTGAREASDVGDYTVTAEFTVPNENYVQPEAMTLNWSITKCVVDLSEVGWNYTAPFTFAIVDGEAVTYSVALTGLPGWFDDLIIYDGVTKASNAGTYEAGYSINSNSANFGNVEIIGSSFARLTWQIEALAVARPEKSAQQTFRDGGYTFEEISGFGSEFDWKSYFDVSVTNAAGVMPEGADGSWTFADVDTYVITIGFKDNMNTGSGGKYDNVVWVGDFTNTWVMNLRIDKLVFDVNGWTLKFGTARPELQADNVSEIEKYFDYVVVKVSTGEEWTGRLENETDYTIALRLKPQYSGNVAVNYKGKEMEETTPFAFTTDPLIEPEYFCRKPSGAELTLSYEYTGEQITFAFGDWFEADKMEVKEGEMFGTACGEYIVTVGFKHGAMAAWGPKPSDGKYDYAPVTITFRITKKQVAVPEGGAALEYNGNEQTFFPEGLENLVNVVSGGTATIVGEYTLTMTLADPENTEWADGNGGAERELAWSITPMKLTAPTLSEVEFVYSAAEQDVSKLLTGFDEKWMTLGGDYTATNVAEYVMTVSLADPDNTEWADGTADISFSWSITPMILTAPTLSEVEFVYSAAEQDVSKLLTGFDEKWMTLGGDYTATNVAEYVMTVSLADPDNTEWTDGKADISFSWSITKRVIAQPTAPNDLTYNGLDQDISKLLKGFDADLMTITGETKARNAGDYTITITLNDSANNAWAAGKSGIATVADSTATTATIDLSWNIAKAKIKADWNDSDIPSLKMPTGFNSSNLGFNYTYVDEDGNTVSKSKLVDGKEYTVTATIKDEFAANFEFVDAGGNVLPTPTATTPYTFTPENTGNTGNIGGGDNTGGNNGGVSLGGDLVTFWVVNGMLLLLIVINLILSVVDMLLRKGKAAEALPAPQPIIYCTSMSPEQLTSHLEREQISGENIWNGKYGIDKDSIIQVNPNTMTSDDWTFVISEKDVLNPDVLSQSNGDFVIFALDKNDSSYFDVLENGEKVLNNKVADDIYKALNNKLRGGSIDVIAECETDSKTDADGTGDMAQIEAREVGAEQHVDIIDAEAAIETIAADEKLEQAKSDEKLEQAKAEAEIVSDTEKVDDVTLDKD